MTTTTTKQMNSTEARCKLIALVHKALELEATTDECETEEAGDAVRFAEECGFDGETMVVECYNGTRTFCDWALKATTIEWLLEMLQLTLSNFQWGDEVRPRSPKPNPEGEEVIQYSNQVDVVWEIIKLDDLRYSVEHNGYVATFTTLEGAKLYCDTEGHSMFRGLDTIGELVAKYVPAEERQLFVEEGNDWLTWDLKSVVGEQCQQAIEAGARLDALMLDSPHDELWPSIAFQCKVWAFG